MDKYLTIILVTLAVFLLLSIITVPTCYLSPLELYIPALVTLWVGFFIGALNIK